MMQPTQLLQNLGMVGVTLEHSSVSSFGRVVIFLLFVNVTNLEPDVFLTQRTRRIVDNVPEALQALGELLLLLVYNSQSEIDLICFLESRLHSHNLGECLLCMLQATVSIVEDTDAIPQFGFLGIWQVIQSLLIRRICLLEVVHHEIAMTQTGPDLTIRGLYLEDRPQILDGSGELILGAQDA